MKNEILTLSEYWENFDDVEWQSESKLPTGFEELNKNQSFQNGVYVVGGRPSIGRTTFCYQMLNQIAENGGRCIYGTYLQSTTDFYFKTLSRKIYEYEGSSAPSTTDLMLGRKESRMRKKVIDELSAVPLDLTVIKLREETSDDLLNLFDTACKVKNSKPVICVDGFEDIPCGREENEADVMRKLKDFSRQMGVKIFLVTRINRQSYSREITAESFSSEILNSADVVWGLQFSAMARLSETKKSEVEEILWNLSTKSEREITLKCVKNGFGFPYAINFKYEAAHDYFHTMNDDLGW